MGPSGSKHGDCVKKGKTRVCGDRGAEPRQVLERFVGVFRSKGWLNRKIGIRYRGVRYRIFCSDSEFLAYRINDHHGISPGVPGWPVCMIREDQIFHDSEMCILSSAEPGCEDWLRCIVDGDFEAI